MRRIPALVAVALLAPACALSHTRDELTLEEFIAALRRDHCDRIRSRCPGEAVTFSPYAEALDDVDCASFDAIGPDAFVASVAMAASRGTVAFDPDAAERCLALLGETCLFGGSTVPACQEAVPGRVAVGAPCVDSVECVDGAWCRIDRPACAGTCEAAPSDGEPCAPGCAACRPDGTCHPGPVEISLRVAGEHCNLEQSGGELTFGACVPGTVCDGTLTCREWPDRDMPCGLAGVPCLGGEVCLDEGAPTAHCVPAEIRRAEGDACGGAVLCDVPHGLACFEGRCARLGSGAGTRCDPTWSDFHCDPGLHCVDATETCEPVRPDRAECTSSDQCASRQCLMGHCWPVGAGC